MAWLIILTFLLTPTYTIKLNLFGLPANFLMLWVVLVWLAFFVWLIIKKQGSMFFAAAKNVSLPTLVLIGLFFFSGIISLFIHGIDRAKLGQFVVLFLQPISLFFIAKFIFDKYPTSKNLLLNTCYLLLALSGLLAIIQYFSFLGLPQEFWGNSVEPKRAVSFFTHPNFFALWSAPLLALLLPDLLSVVKDKGLKIKDYRLWVWLLGAIGLLLSFSRAGWLGLVAAVLVYLIFAADKKIRKIIFAAVIVMVIVIVIVPNLRWRILLPFYGEKSASSRVELWQSGWKGIKQSPILGLGLNGYTNEYRQLQTDLSLPDHNFPHNIFLNLWVETGLLGLVSFVGLVGVIIFGGFKDRGNIIKFGVGLFLITLLVQGQIDNPYFKNDLAMACWIVLALSFQT